MKIKTSITLSEDLVKEIDRLLGRKGNRSALVERALRDYLADKKKSSRDAQTCDKDHSDVKAQPIGHVVEKVVQSHFEIEPGIDEIIWFKKGSDGRICLLEINRGALPAGSILVFSFAPSPPEVPLPIRIADVTPQEWERVKQGDIPLPPGWSLEDAQIFHRLKE